MMSTTVTETVQPMETVQVRLQTKSSLNMTPHPPTGARPKNKLRLDPQRALEPARKKLSTLEAQRIMAVLVDTIRRTELVSAMPFLLENLERFGVSLGTDLLQKLQDHRVIIESFNELKGTTEKLLEREQQMSRISSQADDEGAEADIEDADEEEEFEGEDPELADVGAERPISNTRSRQSQQSMGSQEYEDEGRRPDSQISIGSQAEMALSNLSLVAKQMQFSCKNIMRAFGSNPASLNTVLKGESEAPDEAQELIFNMGELKDILMGMLLTTPVEEAERNQYLKQISERERYNSGIIGKLEKDLKVALDDKDDEIKKRNDVIRRLQSDLHQIKKFSEEHIRRTKSEAEKQEAADMKNSEGKQTKLQQEIATLKTQMQNLIQEHRENEQELRRKKFKVETEVENWIQKYDQDMGERQDEYEEIDAVYTEEKKQLNELEERFKTLETEYKQIMEERRIAREKREAAERQLQMSVKAATTIQAFWRSFKVRKALKSKKKKKGGKKKGKK